MGDVYELMIFREINEIRIGAYFRGKKITDICLSEQEILDLGYMLIDYMGSKNIHGIMVEKDYDPEKRMKKLYTYEIKKEVCDIPVFTTPPPVTPDPKLQDFLMKISTDLLDGLKKLQE